MHEAFFFGVTEVAEKAFFCLNFDPKIAPELSVCLTDVFTCKTWISPKLLT